MTSWALSDVLATSQMPSRHLAVGQSKKGAGPGQDLEPLEHLLSARPSAEASPSSPCRLTLLLGPRSPRPLSRSHAPPLFAGELPLNSLLMKYFGPLHQLFGFNEKLMPLYSKLCQKLGKHHATLKNEGFLRLKKKKKSPMI